MSYSCSYELGNELNYHPYVGNAAPTAALNPQKTPTWLHAPMRLFEPVIIRTNPDKPVKAKYDAGCACTNSASTGGSFRQP